MKTIEQVKQIYTIDGVLNQTKLINDLLFWLDFNDEYRLNELGGISTLRKFLGSPDEFYEKIKSEEQPRSDKYSPLIHL